MAKHKVLCIDDETHNLEALERLLRKKYSIVTANSGAAALEELKNHEFSVIISDQKMPEMTGVQFFEQAKDIQPDAIRVLLTGYTDLESVISAINQGQIYRYITKPWEPEEFLSITHQALEVFEMKNTIAAQNKELQKANEELLSLDKMKSDFMLLVNHELKTPLTGIFSYVQLMGEEKLSEEQSLYIDKISKNTQRLQDLISDTLLITRLQTDKAAMEKVELNIGDSIKGLWSELEKGSKKKLKLDAKNLDGFNQVANEKYITIVIKKILHNCLTHAKDGTGVALTLNDQPNGWNLHIKNEMDSPIEKSVEELLSPFSTDENMLNHTKGSGLGLAVIQSIVNLFGGSIELNTSDLTFDLRIFFPSEA